MDALRYMVINAARAAAYLASSVCTLSKGNSRTQDERDSHKANEHSRPLVDRAVVLVQTCRLSCVTYTSSEAAQGWDWRMQLGCDLHYHVMKVKWPWKAFHGSAVKQPWKLSIAHQPSLHTFHWSACVPVMYE